MIVLKLFIFMLFISLHHCRLPDKVYCANTECNKPISKAKTVLRYISGDADLMSVRENVDAIVFMKSAGTNPDLWYVSVNGKNGFVPKNFLKELMVYEKNPEHVLPLQIKPAQPDVQPNKVQQTHEVVDGTTIYTSEPNVDSQPPITPESTDVSPETTPTLPIQVPSQDLDNSANDNKANTENVSSLTSNEAPSLTEQTTQQVGTETLSSDSPALIEQTTQTFDTKPLLEITTQSPVETSTVGTVENNIETVIENKNQVLNPIKATADVTKAVEESVPSTIQTDAVIATANVPQDIPEDRYEGNKIELETPTALPIQTPESLPIQTPESLPTPQALSAASVDAVTSETVKVSENIDLLTNSLPSTEADVNELNTSANLMNNDNSQPAQDAIQNIPEVNKIHNLKQPDQAEIPEKYDNGMVTPDNSKINNVNGNQEPTTETIPAAPITESTTIENVIAASTENLETATQTVPTSLASDITTESFIATYTENIETETQTVPTSLASDITTESFIATYTENIETETQTVPTSLASDITTESVIVTSTENIETTTQNVLEITPTEDYYMTTEAPLQEDIPSYTVPPIDNTYTTLSESSDVVEDATINELQDSEDNGGFFSNMYSTISDMWPSATESPITNNIFSEENGVAHDELSESNSNKGFSFMNYLWSTYNNVMGTEHEVKALFPSAGETCYTDEYCDGMGVPNNRLLTFLLTAAGSVLLFILGYYYIDSRNLDSKFIADINALQRNLMFTSKECEILKEELATTKNKLAGIEDSSFGKDDMVQSLKEEINELKAQNERLRLSLDDNEKLLRVSENTAGELQNTLSEVENTLSELFGERANSEDQIAELNVKIEAFEDELISITRERDNFQLKYVSAESTLEESKKQKLQLEELTVKYNEANNTIDFQKHEIIALKDAIKELKNGLLSDANVESLIDHTEIKAKLAKALEEKSTFAKKYEIELKERSRLSEELKSVQESLRTSSQQATESTTRLDVLGKYFQERESELLKELSTKESFFLSKQGESASTVEKMELLQKEIQRFKEKCEALTLELAEQESAKRSAISEIESRAHSAWLECRAARREADAARDEAAALRRKLAAMSAADGASPLAMAPGLDVDGALLPPLPLPFLPPPLLPRPPPLGRLPSPHASRYSDRRYSPESRYSPPRRYSRSPEPRYSPDSRYSPPRRSPYSPRSRRRSSRERYDNSRGSRSRNGPVDTETEYNSDSPSREPRRRPRYSRHSGPSSGSGCSSESDK